MTTGIYDDGATYGPDPDLILDEQVEQGDGIYDDTTEETR